MTKMKIYKIMEIQVVNMEVQVVSMEVQEESVHIVTFKKFESWWNNKKIICKTNFCINNKDFYKY